MPVRASVWRLSVAIPLVFVAVTVAAQSRLTSVPPEGSSTIHYDLAADGRLLRIDHETGAGHVVARFPIEQLGPSAVESGWYLSQYAFGYFFSDTADRRRDPGLLLAFDARTEAFRKLHTIGLEGDLAVWALTNGLYALHLGGSNAVFIRNGNEIAQLHADVSLIHSKYSCSADYRYVYIINRTAPPIVTKYDLHERAVVYCLDQKHTVGCVGDEYAHLLCLNGAIAAFYIGKDGSADRRMVVIDLDTLDIRVVSETIRAVSGEFVLTDQSDGLNLLYGIETAVYENDRLTWSGKVHRYQADWTTKTIVELPALEYDATTSAFLFRRDGTPVIVPRLTFTYVSMENLPRVLDKNPGVTWEKRRELVAEIEADRKAKLGQRIEYSFRNRRVVQAEMRELNWD